MNNITVQYFRDLFEEFKRVGNATIEVYIGIASGRTPSSVWGSNTNYATALLVAHMLSTRGPQGGGPAGGALTQETVGDVSRSFATVFEPGSGDALLATTRYGIDYLALRSETVFSATVATPACGGPPWCN